MRLHVLRCSLVLGVAVLVLGHVPFLPAPFVNQECYFAEAVRSLMDPEYPAGLAKYWTNQANPLGYSLLTAAFLESTRLPVTFWSVRLPSLLGGVLMLLGGYRLAEKGSGASWQFLLWIGVVLANPLVWCPAGQATADMLPAGLAFLAGAEAYWAGGKTGQHLAAAALLCAGTVVKYHCLLLVPGLALMAWVPPDGVAVPGPRRILHTALPILLPTGGLLAYLGWVYWAHGILVVPDRFRALHGPSVYLPLWPGILAMYLSYLMIVLGGIALWPVMFVAEQLPPRTRLLFLGVGVLSAALGAGSVATCRIGEMDLGAFDRMVPWGVLASARVTALGLAGVLVFLLVSQIPRSRLALFTAATVLPYLAVAAASRPAQRYLLLVYPLLLWFILSELCPRRRWIAGTLAVVTIVGYGLLSLGGSVYLAEQGRAADRMARWIVDHGDPSHTDPGLLIHHAGQYFPPNPQIDDPVYRVSDSPAGGEVLHQERLVLLGRTIRTFYLLRVRGPDDHVQKSGGTDQSLRERMAAGDAGLAGWSASSQGEQKTGVDNPQAADARCP